MTARLFTIPVLLILLAWAGTVIAELNEFSAYYRASTNGIKGNAERHLIQQDNGEYRLDVSLEAKVIGISIGNLEQTSEFTWRNGNIIPHHYNYMVRGVTSKTETVSFNWDAAKAVSREDEQSWSLDLKSGVLDQLSYQLALATAVAETTSPAGQEFNFQLVDGSQIEEQRYRVLGEELLQTPMGTFNTVKLERVREDDSGRTTNIWFATDWDYLLAKIEQINPDGLRIELTLDNALVGGEQVTPLP